MHESKPRNKAYFRELNERGGICFSAIPNMSSWYSSTLSNIARTTAIKLAWMQATYTQMHSLFFVYNYFFNTTVKRKYSYCIYKTKGIPSGGNLLSQAADSNVRKQQSIYNKQAPTDAPKAEIIVPCITIMITTAACLHGCSPGHASIFHQSIPLRDFNSSLPGIVIWG